MAYQPWTEKPPTADRFSQAREICGHTVATFSDRSAIPRDRIIAIESGGRPTQHELDRWVLATTFPPAWFFKPACVELQSSTL